MKKIISIIVFLSAVLGLASCGGSKISDKVLSVNSFKPDPEHIKPLGRTEFIDDELWLAYSGAGAEFCFNGTKASVTLCGDDAIGEQSYSNQPRIAIFVNGERVVDEVLTSFEKTFEVYRSETAKDTTVRIVKLSEAGNSTCLIKSIEVEAYGEISPTPKKAHSIEFIGDSITCGFGVDTDINDSEAIQCTDATKTYAYIAAELLDCDYSLVAKSGHGVVSAVTSEGNLATWGLMPNCYENFGSGGGPYNGTYSDSVKWNFKDNPSDVIVINLGTNDYSYTGKNPERQQEFISAYVSFLKRIRELNPESKIICTVGMMGDELYPAVEKAVADYIQSTSDDGVTSMKFDVQLAEDGYAAIWHPSTVTHEKAAKKLAEFIKEYMNW